MKGNIKRKFMLFISCILILYFPVIALANYYVRIANTIDAYPYGMNYTAYMEIASASNGFFKSVSQIGIRRTVYKNDVKQSKSTQYDNSSPFLIDIDESFESSSRSNSWSVFVENLLKGVTSDGEVWDGLFTYDTISDSN